MNARNLVVGLSLICLGPAAHAQSLPTEGPVKPREIRKVFGDGKQMMQPVFIDDVGRVLADAALKPEAANQLFELGGPERMSMNDVVRTALDVMGKKRRLLHQPVVLGKTLGRFASVLPGPPLSADAIDFITNPAVADNSAVDRVLKPRLTHLREGLATYLVPQG